MGKISFMQVVHCLALLVSLFLVLSCSNSTGPETDKQAPLVSISNPVSKAVIGDTITIRVNATDNDSITKVEYYIDGIHQKNADDASEPFEYLWNATNLEIGSSHSIFVKASDNAGNIGISNIIDVYYKWILLVQDENDPFARDLNKIYIRSTSATLEFRVETNGNWGDPHDFTNGIDTALFLDIDQDPSTGFNRDSSRFSYQVNDIGADFVGVVGLEGDSLWNWNAIDTTWTKVAGFNYLRLDNNTNFFEVGIDLSDLGTPNIIDVVASNITFESDTIFWDWSPNIEHKTYEIDGLYLGKPITNLFKPLVKNSRATKKHHYILRKNNIDFYLD